MGAIGGQLPTTYSMLYGASEYRGEAGSMVTYAITVALLAAAAFTLVLLAVGQLARDRNAEDVRENVAIRTGVFVMLSLGTVFVATYGMSHLPPSPGADPVRLARDGGRIVLRARARREDLRARCRARRARSDRVALGDARPAR